MSERFLIEVDEAANKMRLDDFLFERIPTLSRMYLRELIKTAKCEVNGRHENSGTKLKPRDFIEVELDRQRGTSMQPQAIPIEVVYEDHHILVVNKPAGMLVHPTHRDKTGTLLNALAYYLNPEPRSGAPVRPGLIHRLDKQTSGLLLVAKSVRVHRNLSAQLMKKRLEKRYLALVDGIVKNDSGMIEAPIGRFAELKEWRVKPDGKPATSRYWVRKRNAGSTLLELEPVTGRTNQLRIHCQELGHPIVGDTQRGGSSNHRLCLHAFRLSFAHPITREKIVVESSPPDF